MSWLHDHAVALGALGSIFMNVSTIIIIYFNVNQLKLNNRSFNVDINFKVFELRKKLYKEISAFIKGINPEKGLRQHVAPTEAGDFDSSAEFKELREHVDNYKYLFAQDLALNLDFLILNIASGIQTEYRIEKLKHKDASSWTQEDQNEMHRLGLKIKEIVEMVTRFDLDQFLPYLNVSNFHKDLMRDQSSEAPKSSALNSSIMFVKKGVEAIPKMMENRKKMQF